MTRGEGGGLTIRKNDFELTVPTESFTRATNEVDPMMVARPEITPPLFIVRPSGKVPASILHWYGPMPPAASMVALYKSPCKACGSTSVRMERAGGGGPISSTSGFLACLSPESFTITVKLNTP